MNRERRQLVQRALSWPALLLLPACAGLPGQPAPRVDLAGIESLPGEGLELRFMLKLRVQNPGDTDLRYDGFWVDLDLRGQRLASGGAPLKGLVPRFGETLVLLPVTASGFSIARQLFGMLRGAQGGTSAGPVTYALRGRLGGQGFGGGEFETRGEIDLARL